MSTEQPNIHLEPVVPSVEFVKHAGSRNGGRTADHAAWVQDMEYRRNRAAEFEAKRQQVKPKELRPFDAEAFKSKSIDYATVEPDEEGMEK